MAKRHWTDFMPDRKQLPDYYPPKVDNASRLGDVLTEVSVAVSKEGMQALSVDQISVSDLAFQPVDGSNARGPLAFELSGSELLKSLGLTTIPDIATLSSFPSQATHFDFLKAVQVPRIDPKMFAGFADLSKVFSELRVPLLAEQSRLSEIIAASQTEMNKFSELSKRLALAIEPHRHYLADARLWQSDLALRMTGISDSLLARPELLELSALSFGRLARFRDTLRYDSPYAKETNDCVETELGAVIDHLPDDDAAAHEHRYDAAGRNPALVAFPQAQYPKVVLAAGFVLDMPMPSAPQPIEHGDSFAVFDDVHHQTLRAVEIHLRQFVASQLLKFSGTRWIKQRVPEHIRTRWEVRQMEDRNRRRPVYELVHYADFTDLEHIITRKDNWSDIFAQYFGDGIVHLRASLQRLAPLRNQNAHHRPMTQSDILTLVTESMRLMRAIRVLLS